MALKDVAADARDLVAKIVGVEQRYGPVVTDIVALALQNQKEAAIRKMSDEYQRLMAELIEANGHYSELSYVRSQQIIEESKQAYEHLRNMLIAAGFMAFVLAVLMGRLISNSQTRALGKQPAPKSDVFPISGHF